MPRILVVEDDVRVGRGLAALLEARGARAHVVTTVREALCYPDRFEVGIIVDFGLPDATGIELLERLRREGVRGPAVLLTGHKSADLASEAAMHGASYCEKASRGVGRMLSTLVEQTRRYALEIAGTQRLLSPTTGVRRRHRPTLLSFGELCDDCVAVIAAEHVAVEPHHDVRDLHAQLRARLDVRGVIVVEPEAAMDSRAAEVVLNLHRIHRDLPLAYVAHQPDPTTRRSILRVGARYIDHTQPTYAKTMREMAPLLAVGAARTASITEAATPRYGFDDTEQRLLPHLLRGAPLEHISESFGVKVSDIRYYVGKLLKKTGATSTAALAARLYAPEG